MSERHQNKTPCVRWKAPPKPGQKGVPVLYGQRMHGGDGSGPGTVEDMLELWRKDAKDVIEGRML